MKFGMTKNGFRKLCVRILSGNGSEADQIKLNEYLAKSSDYKKMFDDLKRIWNRELTFTEMEVPDISKEWALLDERINMVVKNESVEKSSVNIFDRIKSLFVFRTQYAFQLALVLVVLITGYFLFFSSETQMKTLTYSTLNGEQKTIHFPDGSTAYLNNASKIEFPEFFDDYQRVIKLNGEAFFAVKKDSRPFLVETKNAVTRVLGTKFNVWARNDETRVIVKEGKVKLCSTSEKYSGVEIIKNQKSIVTSVSSPSVPENIDSEYMIGWTEGRLVFSKTPLKEVAEELSRFYNVEIIIENESLLNSSLTGSFKNNDVDSVLSIISLALDFKYEKRNSDYRLK